MLTVYTDSEAHNLKFYSILYYINEHINFHPLNMKKNFIFKFCLTKNTYFRNIKAHFLIYQGSHEPKEQVKFLNRM